MKKSFIALFALCVSVISAVASAATFVVNEVGEFANKSLFDYMWKSGFILGMAEVKSTQMTSVAAGQKLLPNADGGRIRLFYARYVQGASTQAINDTIYLGDLPKGARILKDWLVNCGTGTASSTLDIGLRKKSDGTVIDADGIAASVNTAAAGYKDANTGALIAAGEEYVTTEAVEVYGTFTGAVFAASQKLTVEGSYVQD